MNFYSLLIIENTANQYTNILIEYEESKAFQTL